MHLKAAVGRAQFNTRTDSIPVNRTTPFQPDRQPMVVREKGRPLVAQQLVAKHGVADEQIHPAVLIVVGRSHRHARPYCPGAAAGMDQFKRAVSQIAPERIGRDALAVVHHHDCQIEVLPAIVVKINGNGAPGGRTGQINARFRGNIDESAVALVAQQGHGSSVGKVKVEIAVVVVVEDGQPHPHHLGVGIGFGRNFGKTPAATARTIIAPEGITHRINPFVVDQVDVQVAIIVVIDKAGDKAGPHHLAVEVMSHIAEAAIAVVAVQFVAVAQGRTAAAGIAGPVGHVQIQVAIIVKIAPGGRLAIAPVANPGNFGHVNEASPFIVTEKNIGPPINHVQISPAVVVVIGKGRPAAVSIGQGNLVTQRRGAKGAVAIVAKQSVWPVGVGKVQIHPTVAVVIAPGDANGPVISLARADYARRPANIGKQSLQADGVIWGRRPFGQGWLTGQQAYPGNERRQEKKSLVHVDLPRATGR